MYQVPGNRKVPGCNLNHLANINTLKGQKRTMIKKPRYTSTPYPSDQRTECLIDEDPPEKEWRLKSEDYSAARRALYAARLQLA